jgi:hypothetical protein
MNARAWVALAAALLTASCAAPLLKLPTEPGVPVADAADLLARVTATCRGIQTFTAEVGVSGKVGGRGIRRGRLLVGLAAPDAAYLDAPAPFGASVFIFAAVDDRVTLLLPRDRRVLTQGRPADVLEAAAGVPLSPADLRETLTGCAAKTASTDARRIGEKWRVILGDGEWYLFRERDADPWRLVAVVHHDSGRPAWRAEFRDFSGELPRAVRIASADPKGFDVTLRLSQVEINMPLEADVFRPRIPTDYAPLSLEDLRAAGPMAENAASRP